MALEKEEIQMSKATAPLLENAELPVAAALARDKIVLLPNTVNPGPFLWAGRAKIRMEKTRATTYSIFFNMLLKIDKISRFGRSN